MRLVLFDIDGTLIDSGGAGSRALDMAFEEVLSIKSAMDGIRMAGKTDLQIIRESLSRTDIPFSSDFMPRLKESYLRHLRIELKRAGTGGLPPKSLNPGVTDLLDFLLSAQGIRVGLLTGNMQEGAWIKLKAFGIHRYFSYGAFGSDHEDRNKLLPAALEMYRRISGLNASYRDCVVVGDTPMDVNCSKPYGAYSLAVATGPYSVADLQATGADAVFETLPGGDELLSLISY
jgi:phosphoglycolate phosphatase-like HAD superfamily hydrolase